ncbi:MAG: alpha/beta hydrolase fold domain-containing protein [Mariniblastus sp.]
MKLLFASLLCCLFVSTSVSGQKKTDKPTGQSKKPAPQYDASVPKPTLTEIRYGEHKRQVMDFWKADSSKPTPLVFVIHGGGWRGGSKEIVHRFVDVAALLKANISVVAINYRYVTQAKGEDQKPPVQVPLNDAAKALQFVRSKSEQWNIQKNRIGAAGGSAGACSSLWLAYHDDLAEQDSDDLIARESTRLWCAAVKGAQTTLDPEQMKTWTPNSKYGAHAFGLGSFKEFLAKREQILPWIEEYSPYALVSRDDPPVYLFYFSKPSIGQKQKDPTHTSNFGVKLQEHCKANAVACELFYPKATNVKHKTPTEYLIATLNAEPESTKSSNTKSSNDKSSEQD